VNGEGRLQKLILSAGRASGIEPSDLIHVITSATGLDGEAVRNVRVLEHFAFLDVPAADTERVIDAVTGVEVRGETLRLEAARG
jgi:ATP-dependent RNA helicase DeaD